MERLLALKSSLRGSRSETYENVKKKCTGNRAFAKDPEGVYDIIKGKLLRFRKTYEEKQTLALSEWNNLYKGALIAIGF